MLNFFKQPNFKNAWILATLGLACLPEFVFAEQEEPSTTATIVEKQPKNWTLPVSLSLESNLRSPLLEADEHSANLSLQLAPSYKINKHLKTSAVFTAYKALDGEKELALSDAQVGAHLTSQKINSTLAYSADSLWVLPLSESSRKRTGLITSHTLRPNLTIKLSEHIVSGLQLVARLGLTRHIHSFTTSTAGASNAQHALNPRIDIMYSPLSRWHFTAINSYSLAWTYQGTRYENFRFIQEMSFDLAKTTQLSLGHTNQGGALKADGMSSNIHIFNARSSLVYLSVNQEF